MKEGRKLGRRNGRKGGKHQKDRRDEKEGEGRIEERRKRGKSGGMTKRKKVFFSKINEFQPKGDEKIVGKEEGKR